MIGDTPIRGAGCFAIAGEISHLLGALEDTKPPGGEQLGTYDARGD